MGGCNKGNNISNAINKLKKMFKTGKKKFAIYFSFFIALAGSGMLLIGGIGLYGFAILIALCAALILYYIDDLKVHTEKQMHIERWVQEKNIEAWLSIREQISFQMPLKQLSGYAAAPDFANYLLSLVLTKKPQKIVELGCGFSTLVMAKALQKLKSTGHIYSYEADEKYIAQCKQQLQEEGVIEFVTIIYAPYKIIKLQNKQWNWYAIENENSDIDMLIIDGPPKSLGALSRYPALPFFLPKMSAQFLICADDAARDDLQHIAELWKNEFQQIKIQYHPLTRGCFEITER